MKMLNKNKKIVFHSENSELEIPHPQPSSRFVPKWYRTMDGVSQRIETVKKCVPVLDALTSGYIIPLHTDVVWNPESKMFSSNSRLMINSDHHSIQTQNVDLPPEYDPQPHKWINNWFIQTPPGYSTMFIHPLNRLDLPFYSFTGIVDTDKHPLAVNFPFVLRKDFNGVIPAGTPIIQAIPFKRDSWESEVIDTGPSHNYPKSYEIDQPPFGWYKRKWWQRKTYS